MRGTSDDGAVLDAEYQVEPDGGHLALIMESRSGASGSRPPRNPDYNTALSVLLTRLADLDGVPVDAVVDSQHTRDQRLPEGQRRPAPDGVAQGGLRVDQATAAFLALTSPRRAELIVGPAGTGKTYTAARIASAWRAAGMGLVVGISTTSAGRNVLMEAGVPVAENTAQFLGHLPGILRHATRSGAKVVITGDHAQLGAVEAGGGMAMLARKMGHAQLTEAVRFRNDWEGPASLGIRAGDVSALACYDAHGRLHGGSYEEMAEQAARAYLAEYLAGTDVVLTAYEHRECLDLSRRIQGYLLEWGQLQAGATAALREGASAYAGDLIVARQNDNHLQAGEAGRMLANGDLLRVDAIGESHLTVSRLIRNGGASATREWSEPFTLSRDYAAGKCDLGYALTWYTVEGETVSVGIALAHGNRAREGLYVAMSRGARRNEIYAYPSAQEPDESVIGQPPAPDREIARQHRLQADRETPGPGAALDSVDPVSILARAVRRDGADLSAAETREQALSDADHLGVLHAIWTEHCRAEAHARYAQAVREHAAPADAEEILKDTDALWRTVRAAELAGLDADQVIQAAIAGRPFTGARSRDTAKS